MCLGILPVRRKAILNACPWEILSGTAVVYFRTRRFSESEENHCRRRRRMKFSRLSAKNLNWFRREFTSDRLTSFWRRLGWLRRKSRSERLSLSSEPLSKKSEQLVKRLLLVLSCPRGSHPGEGTLWWRAGSGKSIRLLRGKRAMLNFFIIVAHLWRPLRVWQLTTQPKLWITRNGRIWQKL